jgi:hypothetical protein
MTGKQYKNSQSLLCSGAEVITVGHAPSAPANATHSHIALPRPAAAKRSSPRLDLLVEDMFDSWERMMTMQVFLNAVAEGVSKFLPEPLRYDRSKTKDQVFAPTTASPVSAAALYKLHRAEPRAPRKFPWADLPFDVVMTEPRSEKTEEPAAAKDVSREPARKEPPAAPPMAAAPALSASPPAPRPSLESCGRRRPARYHFRPARER